MNPGAEASTSKDILGPETWALLIVAASSLEETVRESASQIGEGVSVTETSLAELLPRRFIPRYDSAFARRMAETASGLLRRLEQLRERGSQPGAAFLTSVAEEMLMAQAIDMATGLAKSRAQAEELEALQEFSFEDRDFEWLYDLTHDGGIEDPDVQARAGFANLGFDEWFEPFR